MFSRMFLIGLFIIPTCLVQLTEAHASCKEVYQADNRNPSGEYTISHNGQAFKAYCSFEGTMGYTYISKSYYSTNIDLTKLYSLRSSAKIRIRWSSGTQKEVVVQNLASYGSPNLYFGRNAYTSYNAPQNSDMQPYLYLGFLPVSQTRNYNTQGYRAGGVDYTFRNCDANPNSYITFFFNPQNRYPARVGGSSSFMSGWMSQSSSLSSSKYMSTNYYFDWEMHMGGCGGFMTSHSVSNTRAALGLPFTIQPCDGVNCLNGGNCVVSGSTGSCSCASGYFGSRCESRNGGWSSWSGYGSCSRSCGSGSQTKTRSCNNPSQMGSGAACSGSSSQTQSCNTHSCPVNGGWSGWGSYGSCSKSCGTGSQSRSRSCTSPAPAHGGAQCSGSGTSSQNCNTHNCPIDGNWGNWGSWGLCSVSCGGGNQRKSRTCSNPAPAYGGANCAGDDTTSQDCNNHACPIHGGWTSWTSWDTCSVTCGGGSQSKERSCTNPTPQHGGNQCSGVTTESQSCNTHNCPIDGVWTDWTAWAVCSVTCGGGSQDRERSCTNPAPAYGGANCVGVTSETQNCNTHNCPINGGWNNWAAWGTCTVTCGGGSQSRDRSCTNPAPAYGGLQCSGSTTSTQACNTHNCPIDGGFTAWTSWTTCSVTCGGGSQDRERTCTNPAPQYGGAPCVGDTSENQLCNTQVCIIDGGWSAWSGYGTCSLTCGGGRASRSRTCSDPYPANGGAVCTGDATEYGDCNTQACPTAAPGTYQQLCPANWFTCQSGSVSCIEAAFACDCSSDCDDGSDETTTYAGCSVQCSSASGIGFSVLMMMASVVMGMLWK